jgi:hypothetical protein
MSQIKRIASAFLFVLGCGGAAGPEKPLAAWDYGDDTEIVYGSSVTHTYARPERYVVKLRATDSILERTASVTVTVAGG